MKMQCIAATTSLIDEQNKRFPHQELMWWMQLTLCTRIIGRPLNLAKVFLNIWFS
jgi:hypothetical protein